MRTFTQLLLSLGIIFIISCEKGDVGTLFKNDLEFLKKHTAVVVLKNATGSAQVAVCPGMQGRVMTSTAAGADGVSFGWINRELISSGENNPHINAFGGEDRFWLGPEGGQFSIYFKKGDPFDLDHWFTPVPINEGAYEIVNQSENEVHFQKKMQLKNYSDTEFELELNRKVLLLAPETVNGLLGIQLNQALKLVAYASDNRVTNIGENAWEKDTGLLSIWILGMYNPSPTVTVVIPFKSGPQAELGPIVNDAYFGKVPADRLKIEEDVLFFSGDGKYRSKIGISPLRCKTILGSYDEANQVLTLVQFTRPESATDYVNSMWEIQEKPYAGDVVNSYNDGPPAPGAKPMGPFYELETSSPALSLQPGESFTHVHRTMHIQGDEALLDEISQKTLGVSLQEIKSAF